MSKGFEIPDEESEALKAVLRKWNANGETWRAIGEALGYPKVSASQSITRAVNVTRPGREMAERIYKRLKTTREAFLVEHGLLEAPAVEPSNADRVLRIAAAMSLSAADAMRVVTGLAAMNGSVTDEEIARLLRPKRTRAVDPTIVTDDDLGGGLAAVPKLPARRKT